MNLPQLIEQFRSEDKCREYLEDLRWPNGVFCPRCGDMSVSKIEKRNQWECNGTSCRYQFSVTAGTVFHDSHLPLWKWFLAIYLIRESKKGISAKQLQCTLGVSYKTAWYLGHRVRSAMEEDQPVPLRGIVEIDETWIGGRKRAKQGESTTAPKNGFEASSTRTPSRASGACSSARSSAPTTSYQRSTCQPTWTRWPSASTTGTTPSYFGTRCFG